MLLVGEIRQTTRPSESNHHQTMKPFLISCLLASQISPAFSAVLISESFGGSGGSSLNGTSADTFSSAITTAGGSANWIASDDFKESGAVVTSGTTSARTASLTIGGYINSARGTADGMFVLTATVASVTGGGDGAWGSVGFFGGPAMSTTSNFGSPSTNGGYGTALLRKIDSNASDYYGGMGAVNLIQAGDFGNATSTFTITMDFTPGGGYNGTTNFGKATFSRAGVATVYTHTFTTEVLISALGFSTNASGNTVFSNMTLTQVPEPSSIILFGAGLGMAFRRRRVG